MAKKPAITGLHSQGIVDDIVKIGIKGVKAAVNTTRANKAYSKTIKAKPTTKAKDAFGQYENTAQTMKNKGQLSYKAQIRGIASTTKKKKK